MTKTQEIITSRSDKSQILNYSNPLFPCIIDKSFYMPEMNIIVTEHWHEELEFLYVSEGSLESSVNGEQITIHEGEGFIINSRRIHSNISPMGQYCILYYELIHPSCMRTSSYVDQKYLFPMMGPNSFNYIHLKKDDWTKQILDDMCPMFDNLEIDGRELNIIEVCLRTLRIIYNTLPPNGGYSNASAEYVSLFKDMVSYINSHYNEKISLDDIAGSASIGKTLCAKIFKQLSQKTPGEYLISFRIGKSIDLLEANELSITDIAYETGFNSASHYTKTFHDLIGCTPMAYRKS